MTKDIFTPDVGESVQIGQQTNSFSINISDELLASLKISQVGCIFTFCMDALLIVFICSLKTMKLHMSGDWLQHMRRQLFQLWNPFRHLPRRMTLRRLLKP
jgi:hypothetical protein